MEDRKALTEQEAMQIGGALQRLQEIGGATIINPSLEGEQKGLTDFLARIMAEHADEFLASWAAVHNEYEPLIRGVAGLLSRANGILARRAQALQQLAAAAQTQAQAAAFGPGVEGPVGPSNIIELKP